MTSIEFNRAFYESRETPTSRAARLVLINKVGVNEAARREGVDKASVSKLVKRISAAA